MDLHLIIGIFSLSLHLRKVSFYFQDCYILDTGSTNGIFAWIGKEASKEERIHAVKAAEGFLAKHGLPQWTRVRNY